MANTVTTQRPRPGGRRREPRAGAGRPSPPGRLTLSVEPSRLEHRVLVVHYSVQTIDGAPETPNRGLNLARLCRDKCQASLRLCEMLVHKITFALFGDSYCLWRNLLISIHKVIYLRL